MTGITVFSFAAMQFNWSERRDPRIRANGWTATTENRLNVPDQEMRRAGGSRRLFHVYWGD
jgi:hypothetical protein